MLSRRCSVSTRQSRLHLVFDQDRCSVSYFAPLYDSRFGPGIEYIPPVAVLPLSVARDGVIDPCSGAVTAAHTVFAWIDAVQLATQAYCLHVAWPVGGLPI